MLDVIRKHPSDIAVSAVEYIETLEYTEKTRQLHAYVLELFVCSLLEDSSAVATDESDNAILQNNWDDYWGGCISFFIDFWIPRRLEDMGEVGLRAPGVMRKWLRWCHERGYFDDEHLQSFLAEVPRGKKKEISRLQTASELLYRLHTPDPHAWLQGGGGKVVSIEAVSKPEAVEDGYMKVIQLTQTSAIVEDEQGNRYSPILLGRTLGRYLRVGDVINVAIGRFGNSWKVLESGNVYASDTFVF